MTGGWQSHLNRTERWYGRLIAAQSEDDKLDFLYAFFESSFAFRDWLIDTAAVTEQEMNDLFLSHVELRLNRDIANSLKHHSIKRPSQEQPPCIASEYAPERPTFGTDRRLVVLSEGKTYDAIDLAKCCLDTWREYTRL
jgi:hypothetical protein